jgi:hypothetical protein
VSLLSGSGFVKSLGASRGAIVFLPKNTVPFGKLRGCTTESLDWEGDDTLGTGPDSKDCAKEDVVAEALVLVQRRLADPANGLNCDALSCFISMDAAYGGWCS